MWIRFRMFWFICIINDLDNLRSAFYVKNHLKGGTYISEIPTTKNVFTRDNVYWEA